MEINNCAIKWVNDRQLPYNTIDSLESIELKTLKVYIKDNLANCFIRPFKSPIKAFIFFDKKPNNSLRLCVDY